MNIQKNQFPSIEQVRDQYLNQGKTVNDIKPQGSKSFSDIYQSLQKTSTPGEIKFSKHATNRLNDRNIELSTNQMDRLSSGMKKAGEKGINESLVLVDELAFIVNIKNSTVITAIDKGSSEENVFTNIDGAVIA